MSEIFAQVLLPLALDQSFTYLASDGIECGDVVRVEFGKKDLWGVVIGLNNIDLANLQKHKIKTILEKNSNIKLTKHHLEFIEKIASYNLANRGLVLRAVIGILNSDKTKKLPEKLQKKLSPDIQLEKFSLKKLSESQQEIFEEITKIITVKPASVSLLDGVTGSGKTEIYFALIAKILSEQKESQILVLLPEIALTNQLISRFEEQFGFKPAMWHSKISKKERREIFYSIESGSLRVLIGARSALFLPFCNLRLIVIDEEHDASFKQEDVFNFHARDMAIVKADIENFPVILSSATPAIETYNNAVLGKYHHFILEQKFGQIKNEIELVDLRLEKLLATEFLSKKLREEIAKNLVKKKQSLLFLNRRGYAPVTLCKACGKKYECSDCDFHLVFHKTKNRLACHHCGHVENVKSECKFCGEKDSLISIGVGVEKLEEEVKELFPEARIALVTSDNVTNFLEAESLVQKILNDEIDIVIGTQMIAKGHDFPNLTLVGIVDADSSLYSSELRALERTYQMLTQVIGRAGRRDQAGKILIQTYNTQNLIFEKIIKDQKKDFYDFEIKNRKMLSLPPFSRLVRFEVSAFKESDAKNFAKKLVSNFPFNDKIEIFGPAPAPLQRLKNRHHFLVNVKAEKKVNLQKLVADVMASLEIPGPVRVRVNVDPN